MPTHRLVFLLTSDEEVGSHTSRAIIEAEAQRSDYVLVLEPARRGDFNALLLRPIHPYFVDMGRMLGMKTIAMLTLIPTIALLALAFRPDFSLIPWSLVALLPSLVLAFLLRYADSHRTSPRSHDSVPVFPVCFLPPKPQYSFAASDRKILSFSRHLTLDRHP